MTRRSGGRLPIVLGTALAALVAACTAAAPPSEAPSVSPPHVTSNAPSASTEAVGSPSAEPPSALLRISGADAPVPGALGSYVWRGVGSDAPWLPGTAAQTPPGAGLGVDLGGAAPIASWTARLAPAADATGAQARGAGSGSGPVLVEAPTSGAWTLAVQVVFGDGLGDATYYWRLQVR